MPIECNNPTGNALPVNLAEKKDHTILAEFRAATGKAGPWESISSVPRCLMQIYGEKESTYTVVHAVALHNGLTCAWLTTDCVQGARRALPPHRATGRQRDQSPPGVQGLCAVSRCLRKNVLFLVCMHERLLDAFHHADHFRPCSLCVSKREKKMPSFTKSGHHSVLLFDAVNHFRHGG